MSQEISSTKLSQFTTFYIGESLFGIEVMRVQEVTKSLPIFKVSLAPDFLIGLINLRGQISTAMCLRTLFKMDHSQITTNFGVVCRHEGNLVSLVVDSIGDVLEIESSKYEDAPETIPQSVKKYIKGIYKLEGELLSVLNLDILLNELSPELTNNTKKAI